VAMKNMTEAEVKALVDPESWPIVERWLARGDGCAVYRNEALDSSNLGHRKFTSFGSPAAQLEGDEPPTRLPDIGGQINWPYQLEGVCRRTS
jgi:hypothetical protein